MAEHIAEGPLGRFLGFWSVFIQAAFAYGGPGEFNSISLLFHPLMPDFLAMTAGEAMYPRRVMPNVFSRVIYRLLVFYVGGVLCVGILVPHTEPLLGTAQKGAGSSPFVLAAVRMGIPALPSIINALILTSAWSCGICLSFTASRNLYSNALSGHAPAFFKKTWRGVPHWCVVAVVAVGLLSFMTLGDGAATAFSWITNLLGGLWIMNLALQHVIYIRFRAGLAAQGIDRRSLPFFRRGQLAFSWIALFGYSLIFLVSFDTRFVMRRGTTERADARPTVSQYSPLGIGRSETFSSHTSRFPSSSSAMADTRSTRRSDTARRGVSSPERTWTSSLARRRLTRMS